MADRSARPLRGSYIPYDNSIATSPFGDRPAILNAPPGHSGVDIRAPYGTPVRAATDGIIYYTGKASKFGNVVVVQSRGPNGEIYDTRYGHIDGIPSLKLKQEIKAGDIVGYVAPVGTSTAPHVHYEVRVFKKDKDALPIGVRHAVNGNGLYEKLQKQSQWGEPVDPETFDYFGNPVFNASTSQTAVSPNAPGAIPLPRPRPKIGEFLPDYRGSVPPLENRYVPANTADDNNRLAPLNPKSLTPDVSKLGAWPQPPYPAGGFFPQTPNGIVNDRFYFDANPSSANIDSRGQAPLPTPTITAPARLPPQSAPPSPLSSPASNAPHWLDAFAPRLDWLPPRPRGADNSDTSRTAGSSAGDWLGLQRSDFGAFKKLSQGDMGKRSDLAPSGDRFSPPGTNPLISMGLLRNPLDANQAAFATQAAPVALSPQPAAPPISPSSEPEAVHWLDALASLPPSPSVSDAQPWLDPETVGKGLRRLLGLPE